MNTLWLKWNQREILIWEFYVSNLKYGFFIHKSNQRCFMNNFPQVYRVILPISAQQWYSVELTIITCAYY